MLLFPKKLRPIKFSTLAIVPLVLSLKKLSHRLPTLQETSIRKNSSIKNTKSGKARIFPSFSNLNINNGYKNINLPNYKSF